VTTQMEKDYDAAVQEAVNRIVARFHPDKIFLFGSLARGQAGPNSDADLLVVMPVTGSKRQQAVQIDLSLAGIPIPTDIIVVTPGELEKYHDTPGTIIREAVQEGKVIYDRAA
jgi:uncharacterized protein